MAIASGTRFGPYEIVAALGAGGMGEVYRAKDSRLGRDVAIKIVKERANGDPERQRRLMLEARAASALNHPNILAVYDVGLERNTSYIVSELVDGDTLASDLRRGPLPLKQLLDLAVQIADGLAAAHEAGIFHRDLKPDNVLVSRSKRVKIIDFGLAKPLAPSGDDHETMTEPGVVLGTVPYMSPEQARGSEADFRSDQFSFGLILYEMATGKPAFRRETPVQTMAAIISEEPAAVATLNPKIPAPLRWVIDRCLAKDARQRYASTTDLFHDLRMLRENLPEAATAAIPALVQKQRRHVAAGLALLGVASGGLLLRSVLVEPTTISFQRLTFGNGNLTGARFVADGDSVIYGAAWDGNPNELYETRPGRPESRSLGLRDAGIWSVSASGQLAIAFPCTLNWSECLGTLAEVPSTGGAPRQIRENVHAADWAPDGELAVAQISEGKDQLRHPVGRVLHEAPGWMSHVRVSPRGDLIAFIDHPKFGDLRGSVCVVDLAGVKTTLSDGWKTVRGLAWTPDGEEVWFTGSRTNILNAGLHAVSRSGRLRENILPPQGGMTVIADISRDGRRVLLWRSAPRAVMMAVSSGPAQERNLSLFDYPTVADVSADGQTVLFYEWGAAVTGTPTVYVRRTDGSDATKLGEGMPLSLSPDGRWALALEQTSPPQLVLLPIGPGERRTLPRGAISEYHNWAAWSPDSAGVFFAADEPGHDRRTYTQDVRGGQPQPVSRDGLVGTSLSPDGLYLTAVGRYGGLYVQRVGVDAEPEPLEGYEDGDTVIQWSGDGSSLFMRDDDDMRLVIFKLDLRTGRRTLWKDLTPPHAIGLIGIATGPGQVRVTPDGASAVYTYWTSPAELYLVEGLK